MLTSVMFAAAELNIDGGRKTVAINLDEPGSVGTVAEVLLSSVVKLFPLEIRVCS